MKTRYPAGLALVVAMLVGSAGGTLAAEVPIDREEFPGVIHERLSLSWPTSGIDDDLLMLDPHHARARGKHPALGLQR